MTPHTSGRPPHCTLRGGRWRRPPGPASGAPWGRWPRCGRGGSGPPTQPSRPEPQGQSRAERGRAELRHHAGHGEELAAEHGGGMALPPAEQRREGLCRGGRAALFPGPLCAKALPGKAGVTPGQRVPPGSASIPISFPRTRSVTRRGRARAGGSRRWSWWGSRSTKPRRKGQSSSSSTSEEATTRVRDAACPAGLGGYLWLRLGESRMDGGNGTAGPPCLWLLALGAFEGDGPSLDKGNLQQVKSYPANSCYESSYKPFLSE